jgi:succinate dehydrogenase / fumarate reductase, membrane anchor subunit
MCEIPRVSSLRSPLGRARGSGSAHSGFHHWWVERLEAVALVPLTVWFILSVLHLIGGSHQAVIDWLSSPVSMALMLLMIVTTFHHFSLGVQSVLDDYVHRPTVKLWSLFAIKAASVLVALLCIVSVLRIGL